MALPTLCLSLRPAGVVGLYARLGNVGVIPRAMDTGHLDDEGHWGVRWLLVVVFLPRVREKYLSFLF